MRGRVESLVMDIEGKQHITFSLSATRKVDRDQNIAIYERIKNYEDLVITAKPYRKSRSLDANAYCWILLGELAKVLKTSDVELYQHYVRMVGVSTIVPIKDEAKETFMKRWLIKGDGWFCVDLGECRTIPGFSNIKLYFGSSTYDSAEMARLINEIVIACKENGIETMTPDEIADMKSRWANEKTAR